MPQPISILHNLNLIDMSPKVGERIQKNKIIILEGERIQAVLDASELKSFKQRGYECFDCSNTYLIPGLIDLHVHCTNPFINPQDAIKFSHIMAVQGQIRKNLHNCIRAGVTTIRDLGAPPFIVRFMRMIDQGLINGPRIIPSLSMISCPNGYPDMVPSFNFLQRLILGGQFAEKISNCDQAEKIVNVLADKGAEWIKTVYQEQSYLFGHAKLATLPKEIFAAIVHTAHARGKKTALHSISSDGFRMGLSLQVDTIEHLPLEALSNEDVNRLAESKITIVPTLIAPGFYLENMLPKLLTFINTKDDCMVPQAREYTLRIIKQIMDGKQSPTMVDYKDLNQSFGNMIYNLRRLYEAGARIGFGTDAGGTDIDLFGLPCLEMNLLAEAGISNYEILEIATRKNAIVLGIQQDLGSIEQGKLADLVQIEDNPLDDLRNVDRVLKVWKAGRVVYEG